MSPKKITDTMAPAKKKAKINTAYKPREGPTTGDLTAMKADEVRQSLKDAGILFHEKAVKPELLAIWCLLKLKLVRRGDTPNKIFVEKIINWNGNTQKELIRSLERQKLDVSGSKWERVEALIRAGIAGGISAVENPSSSVLDNNEDEDGGHDKAPDIAAEVLDPTELRKFTTGQLKDEIQRRKEDAGEYSDDQDDGLDVWSTHSLEQIQKELTDRGLALDGTREDLVQRLNAYNAADEEDAVDWAEANYKVPDLKAALLQRGLSTNGFKGNLVARLQAFDRKMGNSVSAHQGVSHRPETTHPTIVNLLVSLIYGELVRTDSLALLPGYPTGEATAKSTRQLLDTLPVYENAKQLAASLKKPRNPANELLFWICTTFGENITIARGDMKIDGMPDSIVQFVISKPTRILQDAFSAEKAKYSTKSQMPSMVAFHGTSLLNVHSILRSGFIANGGGVWAAEHPGYSYRFALKAPFQSTATPAWRKGDPYKGYGALLGCELVAHPNDSVHEIPDPNLIIVRYLFLLSPKDLQPTRIYGRKPNSKNYNAPPRDAVVDSMLENFARI